MSQTAAAMRECGVSRSADAVRSKMLTSIDEGVYAVATAKRRFLHKADECVAGFLGLPLERGPLAFVEAHIQRSQLHPGRGDHLVDLFEGEHAEALSAKPDAIGEIAVAPTDLTCRFGELSVLDTDLRESGRFLADLPEMVADPSLRRPMPLPSINDLAGPLDAVGCSFHIHPTKLTGIVSASQ